MSKAFLIYVKSVVVLFVSFLFIQYSLRLMLALYSYSEFDIYFLDMMKALIGALVYDVTVFSYLLPIMACLIYRIPLMDNKLYRLFIIYIYSYILIFISVTEYLFWDEFSSRFNFIAVDYLVYTHEVVGNIFESYPVFSILGAISVICFFYSLFTEYFLTKFLFYGRLTRYNLKKVNIGIINKVSFVFCTSIIPFGLFFIVTPKLSEISSYRYYNEFAKNGYFELFSAFRNNDLSYEKFYITERDEILMPVLQDELKTNDSDFTGNGIERKFYNDDSQELRHNIMLITVESLSAEFLKAFGNIDNITPHLDEMAEQSIFFTNLYATGTRTVYGLSAINLSIPPSPGNSIVRKMDNENLVSLAYILNSKGYDSKFIYGGYGYFDNMNYFFENNGYKVVDRSDLSSDEITFANIWGVCDEDLFHRVIRESDVSYNSGKPFFNMIMTTSNHRPFTYPEGRIDIPSGSGRNGAVKYTDHAIGNFLRLARKRPWFDNTLFIIVADHTANSAGKMELEKEKYRIPMWIYGAPITKPLQISQMISQIDIAPTILGLLKMQYNAPFYGKNALNDSINRSFISNYQKLGYLTDDILVILKPIREMTLYAIAQSSMKKKESIPEQIKKTVISYFQFASKWQLFNSAKLEIQK